jgi:hypothetical protein
VDRPLHFVQPVPVAQLAIEIFVEVNVMVEHEVSVPTKLLTADVNIGPDSLVVVMMVTMGKVVVLAPPDAVMVIMTVPADSVAVIVVVMIVEHPSTMIVVGSIGVVRVSVEVSVHVMVEAGTNDVSVRVTEGPGTIEDSVTVVSSRDMVVV